jgi:hypothetical protein
MSQYQPPMGPMSYASPQFPTPSPRPTSVTVFAILGIIFGSIGVLAMLCSLPQYLGVQFAPNPIMDGIRKDPLLMSVTIGSLVIGLGLSILELFASIGMLSLRRGARRQFVWYAILYIIVSILSIMLSLAVTNPRMQEVTQRSVQSNPQLNTPQMKAIMQYSSYGGVCMAVVMLIWPILILYFMTRPHVKHAFGEDGSSMPPMSMPPMAPPM